MAEQLALRKLVFLWINNGDMKIFTVPTWLAQDADLISTVLLDLRCQADKEGDYRNKHLSKEINDCEVQLLWISHQKIQKQNIW